MVGKSRTSVLVLKEIWSSSAWSGRSNESVVVERCPSNMKMVIELFVGFFERKTRLLKSRLSRCGRAAVITCLTDGSLLLRRSTVPSFAGARAMDAARPLSGLGL